MTRLSRRLVRRALARQSGAIFVNVYDDDPPSIPLEVTFPDDYMGPHPLDTRQRMDFLRWLQARTEAAGFRCHVPPARWETRDWAPPVGNQTNTHVRVAFIENALLIENPDWPGLYPSAPWNDEAHGRFLERMVAFYQGLGPWMGIPLHVGCES